MSDVKKRSIKNDMRYVAYVVSMYLRGKRELEEFRDDLNQEGMLALLQGRDDYDPQYGMDRDLYLAYRIKQGIQNYINRRELKHFSGPKPTIVPIDTEGEGYSVDIEIETQSNYWELGPTVGLDELEDTSMPPVDSDKLSHMTDKVDMVGREAEALELYLTCGSYKEVGDKMSLSRERVRQLINSVIDKCKEIA